MTRGGRALEVAVRHPRLKADRRKLAAAIGVLDQNAGKFLGGCPEGELSVAFLSDRALAALHGDFLEDPTQTDVITFSGDAAHGLAGEICVSVDAAVRQVGPSGPRFSAEVMLYVVHGWLHLAGYDDLSPAKKRVMRRAEKRALALLAQSGSMPRFKLA